MEEPVNVLCAADLFLYEPQEAATFQEFFVRYKDQFPMLAVVIDGLYGQTHFDTFENLQVMRIHGYTSQPRVKAIDDKEENKYRHLTIPVNMSLKYQVVRSNMKLGKLQSMAEILEENELPVKVKMAGNSQQSVRFGNSHVFCDQFGQLLIWEKCNEHYLLVNHIDTKELVMNPIVRLGALSQDLSATPVLGFRYDTEENYRKFLFKLDQQVAESDQDYDVTRGDQGIAKYIVGSNDTHTGGERTLTLNEATIETDLDYGDPPPVPPRSHGNDMSCNDDSSEDECGMYITPAVLPRKPDQTPTSASDQHHIEHIQVHSGRIDDTEQSGDQECFSNAGGAIEGDGDDYILIPVDNKPPLRIKCNRSSQNIDPTSAKSKPTGEPVSETKSITKKRNIKLNMFTINDVCETLESLNLDKYIEKFKEEQISGRILTMLSDQDMQYELGMRRLEAVRLCAFVKFGHIPM